MLPLPLVLWSHVSELWVEVGILAILFLVKKPEISGMGWGVVYESKVVENVPVALTLDWRLLLGSSFVVWVSTFTAAVGADIMWVRPTPPSSLAVG